MGPSGEWRVTGFNDEIAAVEHTPILMTDADPGDGHPKAKTLRTEVEITVAGQD